MQIAEATLCPASAVRCQTNPVHGASRLKGTAPRKPEVLAPRKVTTPAAPNADRMRSPGNG